MRTELTPRAQRLKPRLISACYAGLPPGPLFRRVAELVREAVPFDASGWRTTDPATLLWTGSLLQIMPPSASSGFIENEVLEPDFAKFADLARRRMPAAVLSTESRGDPDLSARYRKLLRPAGLQHELRVSFAVGGACWGTACLARGIERPDFSEGDARFLGEVAPHVAEGLRVSLRPASGRQQRLPGPGTVLLNRELEILSMTSDAEELLKLVDASSDGVLPDAAYAVAARAWACVDGRDGPVPSARLRTEGGGWLELHASALQGSNSTPHLLALTIAPADPLRVAAILVDAFDLSEREREVVGMLLRGEAVADIARGLSISPYTVRDHIKAIFAKVGVSSRRELAGRLLLDESVG